ncbi:MAG TPA: ABC transporter ATP-binding protein [Amaricoccus sp.]|uniref:ABC transporter ATP-binding protein n=1 Tax=Amaricoccus sp. TaxID=1872485 RepID=UPI002BEE53FE|nr:ABC transporter ATP-binding protein [Amaricoccus sp.]HRO10956.1 ABC transporter ATP-binding protein [Amaricoccus sp.]
MTSLATCDRLTVRYPGAARPALADLTLALHAGEKLAVVGESGSGKSTLARALAGLLPVGTALSGAIRWSGPPPRPGRDIGTVFQDPGASLDPLLTVGAHLVEVLRAHLPLGRAEARARAAALLARVHIPDPERALAAWPHQFSGGQAQRIAIALAIAAGPHLLVADEATSALDVLVQAEIVALLRELCRDAGMTLLFITHDIALAGTLADRVAVLHDARLVEIGPAARLLAAPREPYTRALLAAQLDLASPRLVGTRP